MILPYVLDFYGEMAEKRLSDLARAAGMPSGAAFIQAIREQNARLGIPAGLDCIREEDIPLIAAQALRESNPLYPVPKIIGQAQCEALVAGLRKERQE